MPINLVLLDVIYLVLLDVGTGFFVYPSDDMVEERMQATETENQL